MKSRIALTTFLGLIVLLLVFLNMKAILRPSKYEEVYNQRRELNTNRLTAVVELQKLYKKTYGQYCSDIDTLVEFYETGFYTVRNTSYRTDNLPEGLTVADVQNMSMEEREERHLNIVTEERIPIKNQMDQILAGLNEKRNPEDRIVMEKFQFIPYSDNVKYKIETCEADRADTNKINKFAVYVPVETLMDNFDQSIYTEGKANVFKKMLYKGLADDKRESKKCVGLQLGDTVSTSLDIKDYGVKPE